MSYLNQTFTVETGTPLVIPLNRWGKPGITIQLTSTGSGTLAVAGTLAFVNRGETPAFSTIDDIDGAAMTALTDPGITASAKIPLEAIQLTATTATVTGRVMQSPE